MAKNVQKWNQMITIDYAETLVPWESFVTFSNHVLLLMKMKPASYISVGRT